MLEVSLTVAVAFRTSLKRWSNFPEQRMEVGDGVTGMEKRVILGEINRLCSDEKVEDWEAS